MLFLDPKFQVLLDRLETLNSDIYIRRHKQMNVTSQLVVWSAKDIDITSLADESFIGTENLLRHLKEIDRSRLIENTFLSSFKFVIVTLNFLRPRYLLFAVLSPLTSWPSQVYHVATSSLRHPPSGFESATSNFPCSASKTWSWTEGCCRRKRKVVQLVRKKAKYFNRFHRCFCFNLFLIFFQLVAKIWSRWKNLGKILKWQRISRNWSSFRIFQAVWME